MTEIKSDIIIIGAGPVGCYTAAILGHNGIKVTVYEQSKQDEVKKNVGIIHFDVNDYEPLGLKRPAKESPIYIGTFEKLWQVPFDASRKFPVNYPTDIIYMNPFISMIADYASQSGNVKFVYEAPFEQPIVEGDTVVGVKIGNGIGERRAKIIIDCSGRKAVVRNALPNKCNVPKLIHREDRLFRLHMERWKCTSDFPKNSNTFVSFKGFANQVGPDQTLVGASTLKGWEETKKHFEKMVEKQDLDKVEHNVEEVLSGEVPYDFPPYSLVGNGFLSIGDSAFQNKPFNGEGMSSGMKAAQLALPVILDALKTNNVSRKRLWAYNVAFFRGFGADFAMIRGTGETLVELTPEEFDWMFRVGFTDKKMLETTWHNYQTKVSLKIIPAVIRGIFRWSLFKRILKGLVLGSKLKKLYKKYPENPDMIMEWKNKFDDIMNW